MQWYVFLNRIDTSVWLLTVKSDDNVVFNQFISNDDAQSLKRAFEHGQLADNLLVDDVSVALDFSERVFFSINDNNVIEHKRRLGQSQSSQTKTAF